MFHFSARPMISRQCFQRDSSRFSVNEKHINSTENTICFRTVYAKYKTLCNNAVDEIPKELRSKRLISHIVQSDSRMSATSVRYVVLRYRSTIQTRFVHARMHKSTRKVK